MENQDQQIQSQSAPRSDLNVSQKNNTSDDKYIIADQRKRVLWIDEQLKRGDLPLDKRKEYEKEREELEKSIVDVKNKDLQNKNKGKEEEDVKDIFKDDDILKYMYNEWLLAFANWSFKKLYKGVDWLAQKGVGMGWKYGIAKPSYYFYKGIKYGGKKLFTKTPPRDDETTRQAAAINEIRQDSIATRSAAALSNLENLGAVLHRIAKGEETAEDKKHPIYNLYLQTEPAKRKDFPEGMHTQAQIMTQNMLEIYRLAENLVALKHVQNGMETAHPQTPTNEVYKKEVQLMALLIARKVSSDNDFVNGLKNLDKHLTKAQKSVDKGLQKGQYQANNKAPADNKHLKIVYNELGLTENGSIPQEKQQSLQQTPANRSSQQTMLEALVKSQGDYAKLMERKQDLENREAANRAAQNQWTQNRSATLSRLQQNEIYKKFYGVNHFAQNPKNTKATNTNSTQPTYRIADQWGGR